MGLLNDVLSRLRPTRRVDVDAPPAGVGHRASSRAEEIMPPDEANATNKADARHARVSAKAAEMAGISSTEAGDAPRSTEIFIAWSSPPEDMTSSEAFRMSCEKHIRSTQVELSKHIGEPAHDGVIIFEQEGRALAVAALLCESGQTLPTTNNGRSCSDTLGEEKIR